ncbi:hypothetical protein SCOCK_60039 [Actinacidiphila cocklensis]|uniref:Uncharacterized protein n=1 Tax=Actinacidiphila cocklensis TaxID=887465 RepID=A0A9W4GUN5_9ACTN|nr:hypothetical protein SCOCK_60039 [Actinacidiphila cocklensis]
MAQTPPTTDCRTRRFLGDAPSGGRRYTTLPALRGFSLAREVPEMPLHHAFVTLYAEPVNSLSPSSLSTPITGCVSAVTSREGSRPDREFSPLTGPVRWCAAFPRPDNEISRAIAERITPLPAGGENAVAPR